MVEWFVCLSKNKSKKKTHRQTETQNQRCFSTIDVNASTTALPNPIVTVNHVIWQRYGSAIEEDNV